MAKTREYVEIEPYATPAQPPAGDLETVAKAALGCQACHLWRNATQTVFGEGRPNAQVVMVGEQPGDREDLQGHPFVGPAGRVLDEGLVQAGIDRKAVYVTNAVKHFKWEPRGYRRLHKKPNRAEMRACRPWLETEIRLIQPVLIVALGATAAQSLMGPLFKVTQERGKVLASPFGPKLLATVHPSVILRSRDEESRQREMDQFIRDLKVVHQVLEAAERAA